MNNKEEAQIALAGWKDIITDAEWNDWQEYKANGTYPEDLLTHNNDERITAIYFFCAARIAAIKERYK